MCDQNIDVVMLLKT